MAGGGPAGRTGLYQLLKACGVDKKVTLYGTAAFLPLRVPGRRHHPADQLGGIQKP